MPTAARRRPLTEACAALSPLLGRSFPSFRTSGCLTYLEPEPISPALLAITISWPICSAAASGLTGCRRHSALVPMIVATRCSGFHAAVARTLSAGILAKRTQDRQPAGDPTHQAVPRANAVIGSAV